MKGISFAFEIKTVKYSLGRDMSKYFMLFPPFHTKCQESIKYTVKKRMKCLNVNRRYKRDVLLGFIVDIL